jgi:myo-inositol 2-dehydrogenase/D-chiro-inositol 1-dehydrogenase
VSDSTLKVAVIGCGDIAVSQHLPALANDSRFDVIAVVDPERHRAQSAAEMFSIGRVLTDAEEALALKPDVAVLATPPHVTPKISGRALDAGIHVLCEKPVAVTLEAADELVARAAASDRVLQVGFKNRFSPLTQELRTRVTEGRLGGPLIVRIAAFDEAYDPRDTSHSERIRLFLEHGPPVVHEGAHAADLLGWMLGPPVRVWASAVRSRPEFPSPNYHAAAIEYEDGSVAKLEVGWWVPHVWPGEVQVLGPAGSADLSRPGGFLRFHDGTIQEEIRFDDDWQTVCFRGQLDAFAEAVETGVQRGADAVAGRDALDLTLAIVEAAETGQPVGLAR